MTHREATDKVKASAEELKENGFVPPAGILFSVAAMIMGTDSELLHYIRDFNHRMLQIIENEKSKCN